MCGYNGECRKTSLGHASKDKQFGLTFYAILLG